MFGGIRIQQLTVWRRVEGGIEIINQLPHFESFGGQPAGDFGQTSGAISSAQGLDTGGRHGGDAITAMLPGAVDDTAQQFAGKMRKVTGNQQIPVGFSGNESAVEASQRPTVRPPVVNNGQVKFTVQSGRTDQRNRARRLPDQRGEMPCERHSVIGEQGFVATHACAASAHQDKSSPAHEKMIALVSIRNTWTARKKASLPEGFPSILKENKSMHLCFLLFVIMLAASGLQAEPVQQRPVSMVHLDPKTGQLVRSFALPSRPPASTLFSTNSTSAGIISGPDTILNDLVEKAAAAHNVDPLLIHSVIKVESNYNTFAVSPKGAEGLMQLIPATAKRFGAKNSFNAQENIEAGVKYLKHLQDLYKDDRLALAAYNSGEGAVAKYKAIPPYPETQSYVEKVGRKYGDAKRAAEGKKAKPATIAAVIDPDSAKTEERHPKLQYYTDAQGRLHLRTQ